MATSENLTPIPDEFSDIAPYTDIEFKEKIHQLVSEPGFQHAVKYIMPNVDYKAFAADLENVESQESFQKVVMRRFLEYLEHNTSAGVTISGIDRIDKTKAYTFISNHRDIVLDASFLNLAFIREGVPLTQVAIGNNLLIYQWITDLVKLNRSFIVKRDVKMIKALEAAKQLSAYVHFAIQQRNESVWIAQREGRAKDSNDLTQESLIKMLSLAGSGGVKENILEVRLCPVSISYEYDPNDYLKVREFLLKRRNPDFKKSQRDDLFSMETGLLKNKGRIHYALGDCINDELAAFQSDNRVEILREACRLIDRSIHRGYMIYQGNFIAYDELNHSQEFRDRYSDADVEKFNRYIHSQLEKVDVPDINDEERQYMWEMMLTMYANPLKNKLQSKAKI